MPKQRYDNEAVGRAKKKVADLTSKGYRLNNRKASTHYNEILRQVGTSAENRAAKKELESRATGNTYK